MRLDHLKGGSAGFQVTLGTVQRMGSVTTFASPTINLTQGDSVELKPADWSRLDTSAVSVTVTHGSITTKIPPPPPQVAVPPGSPTAEGLMTLTVNVAPIGVQPLAQLQASCTGEESSWVKLTDTAGSKTTKTFSLKSGGCIAVGGTTETVLVRALDAQGVVSMIASVRVTVPYQIN